MSGANAIVPVPHRFHDELLMVAVVVVKLPDRTTVILAGEPVDVDVKNLPAMTGLNDIGSCSCEATTGASTKRRVEGSVQVRLPSDCPHSEGFIFRGAQDRLRRAGLVQQAAHLRSVKRLA